MQNAVTCLKKKKGPGPGENWATVWTRERLRFDVSFNGAITISLSTFRFDIYLTQ